MFVQKCLLQLVEFQVYQGENIPRFLGEEQNFSYIPNYSISRDIISFFFLTFPFVFPPTIERVETLVEWKTKFFERKTIYRRSSLEMFNCRCGSFKCGIGHEIHGQTQSTRYSDNWFVHRFVPRCLYIDRYKTCSIYFFFLFFHAVLLEFLRVTFMHVPAYPG